MCILGVGLMGASLARAMKKRSLCGHVAGHGRSEENLRRAVEMGIIDSYELEPGRACEGAGLVVFAAPVGALAGLAERVSGSLGEGAVAIDMGSVKGKLVHEMEKRMPRGVGFVGCHPIAGSERSGLEASSPELFDGALCIITGTEKSDKTSVEKIAALWSALGCRVRFMDAGEHDRVYGLVSHFPHLAAYAMLNTAGDVAPDYLGFAGPGFLDTTRIGLSSSSLWRDICLMNRENLIEFVDVFMENLKRLKRQLREGDGEGLDAAFERARALRRSIER